MSDLIKGHFYRVKTIEELESEGYIKKSTGSYNTVYGFNKEMQAMGGQIGVAIGIKTLTINGKIST